MYSCSPLPSATSIPPIFNPNIKQSQYQTYSIHYSALGEREPLPLSLCTQCWTAAFNTVTKGQIAKAEWRLNNRPRIVLDGQSPAEVFHAIIQKDCALAA
ncbi:MAG: hypothetical protein J6386_06905 [Candidatus Synoicihabitans palmerolidicus]|nr:hypothetical protein [Candidatus Synoicihabitans palmerolidicus]